MNAMSSISSTETSDMASPSSTTKCKKCPGCKAPLMRLLQQQGAGGWKSITAHLAKCRLALARARTLTQPVELQLSQYEQLAATQCHQVDLCKAARRAAAPERRAAAAARAEVPWFVKQQQALAPAAPALPDKCCSTCGALFAPNDTVSFEQHSTRCVERREKHQKHFEIVYEATADKADKAQKRVDTLSRRVADKKAELKRKQEAIEEGKRKKRIQQGKKKKTVKKHSYAEAEQPDESDQPECTIQGCMQRLKEAEKELKDGKQRAQRRQETAEIAAATAEGVQHPLLQARIKETKHKKEANRLAAYRKAEKKKSKVTKAEERKDKSKDKSKRRAGADSKARAGFGPY